MTTPSTPRKAGPLLGTGAQTSWPFTFKVFAASDIAVTIANNLGVETALALGSDYSVTLNSNQETSPGGTVTYPISGSALPTGSKLTIFGNLPYDQPLDLPSGGNFSPLALENQLDRLTMQIQQLREQVGRAVQVSVTTNADVGLPPPTASNVIGWNESGDNLENYPLSELATSLAFATYRYDTFTGDGAETDFTLSADPVTLGNLDVAISGVTQVPGIDYVLVGGVLQFTSAPANGTTILARFGEGIASGPSMDSYDVRFRQAGTGAVDRTAEAKMRESVSVKDFGAVGNGVADDTAAFIAAVAASKAQRGVPVYVPNGTYIVNSNLELGMASYNNTEGAVSIIGESQIGTVIKPGVTGTTALFSLTGGNLYPRASARIENLTIDPGVFKSGQGCAILIDCTIGNNVRNVTIRNMKFGVWLYAGTSFGGGGWVEYNDFENVTTDFCDECYRLEQSNANTNPIPSHGYNNWRHCLGNVFALDSSGGNKQIFFHLVNSTVNFYNSNFEFYVNTQDGGTLVIANGNGGGPLGAGRVGLTPSNSGSFHVESSGDCFLYGTQRFWWQGLFSYVSSSLTDFAGESAASPGQSVFLCDNYVYSGTNLNDPLQIERFQSTVLTPNYPIGRVGQNAPYISVEDNGLRKGMVVYADQSDSGAVFGLGLRAAGAKLQAITMNWWQTISGKLLANKYGFRLYSDVVTLTTSPTSFASFPEKSGSFIVTVKGVFNDYPAYTFSVSKSAPFGNKQIAILSAAPKTTTNETLAVTWPDNAGLAFATSAIGADGDYNITVIGSRP